MSYQNLTVERRGQVFIITMRKAPENRIDVAFAQEIVRALRDVERQLGRDTEGAVIIRGSDAKFWCTVRPRRPVAHWISPLPHFDQLLLCTIH